VPQRPDKNYQPVLFEGTDCKSAPAMECFFEGTDCKSAPAMDCLFEGTDYKSAPARECLDPHPSLPPHTGEGAQSLSPLETGKGV